MCWLRGATCASWSLHDPSRLLFYVLQGVLRGYDQSTNVILDECHERVYSTRVRSRRIPETRATTEASYPDSELVHVMIDTHVSPYC